MSFIKANNELKMTESGSEASLKEKLTEETLECNICIYRIKKNQPIWSCGVCWTILHYDCVEKWITESLKFESGFWRCPVCNITKEGSLGENTCFCGKFEFPDYNPFLTPHTCGNLCQKKRPFCDHPCPSLCHPGPCPPCRVEKIKRKCSCGKMTFSMFCGEKPETCNSICGKKLNCGLHFCSKKCHNGECSKCFLNTSVKCFCGKNFISKICGSRDIVTRGCQEICNKLKDCKKHRCEEECHEGPCKNCNRLPKELEVCPCGKETVKGFNRKDCEEKLWTCGNRCNKLLECKKHRCSNKCHDSPCENCRSKVSATCRCGSKNRKMVCHKYIKKKGFNCKVICNTKLSCTKHFCKNVCCEGKMIENATIHFCKEKCGRLLNCRIHTCNDNCQSGECYPCRVPMSDGVSCKCGTSVKKGFCYCEERVGLCARKCGKTLNCGHKCEKRCHFGECPPCENKVSLPCAGNHKLMKTDCKDRKKKLLCDKKCSKILICGTHFCEKTCHEGECDRSEQINPGRSCRKKCYLKRSCGHKCRRICHPGTRCEVKKCLVLRELKCPCGTIKTKKRCEENAKKTLDCGGKCKAIKLAENFRKAVGIRPDKTLSGFNWDDANLWKGDSEVESLKRKSFPHFSLSLLEISSVFEKRYIQKLEERFKNFQKNKEERTMHISGSTARKRMLLNSLAFMFGFKGESMDLRTKPSVSITKESAVRQPAAFLSEALEEYFLEKHDLEKEWPINCVLHIKNPTKSQTIIEAVTDSLKYSDFARDILVENFRNLDLFVVLKDDQEVASCKSFLGRKFGSQFSAFPAAFKDEVGLRNFFRKRGKLVD